MGLETSDSIGAYRWSSVDPDQLLWNGWNDEYVVFHRPSGRTHFLNAASAVLVRELLVSPKTSEDVVQSFPPPDLPSDPNAYHDEILALLERLEHLGLIERA